MRWTYTVTDTRAGAIVANDVRLRDVTFTDSLNSGGAFTGTLKAHSQFAGDMDQYMWSRVIWPRKDRRPMGAYVLTGYGFDASSPETKIQAVRFDVLLARRLIRDTLTFLGVDQLDIARDLIRYATGLPTLFSTPVVAADPSVAGAARLPWVDLGDALSGVLRTRQETPGNLSDGYPASARKVAGTVLRQLAEVINGFEFRIDYYTTPGEELPRAKFTFGYPKVGRPADSPGQLALEYPSNVVASLSRAGDALDLTTRVDVTGKEVAAVVPVGSAVDAAAHLSGRPLLESVWSEQVEPVTELNDKAARRLVELGKVRAGWSVTLNGNQRPVFGSYSIGDHLTLRVRRAGTTVAVDHQVRVTGWSVKVDDSGNSEQVVPTLEAA